MIRLLFFISLFAMLSCSNRKESKSGSNQFNESSQSAESTAPVSVESVELQNNDSLVLASISDSLANIIKDENLQISYIHPYRSVSYKTEFGGKYSGSVITRVDTTDFVVSIIKGSKSRYAVAGYNHIYEFTFTNVFSQSTLSFSINKKKDLKYLLGKSDVWLESNLDVWNPIYISSEQGVSIFEFNVNPRYNYGDSYFFVFDSLGAIKNQGYNLSWGGDGPDGIMQVIGNTLVTCNEVYDIEKDTILKYTRSPSRGGKKFSDLTDEEKNKYFSEVRRTHAMRVLNDSVFFVVYNRPGKLLEENGVIFTKSLDELATFKYYGLMGDMDATLMINEKYAVDTVALFDYERNSLLLISKKSPYQVLEIDSLQMERAERAYINTLDKLIIKGNFPEFEVRKDQNGKIFYFKEEY